MKKRDIPSIAKGTAPNIGSMLEIHLNFIIPWRLPSPSKDPHKRIVIVNVNKDQSNALFHKRAIFSRGVIKITSIPIKRVINTKYNMKSKFYTQGDGTWTHNQPRPKRIIYLNWYTPCLYATRTGVEPAYYCLASRRSFHSQPSRPSNLPYLIKKPYFLKLSYKPDRATIPKDLTLRFAPWFY